MKHPPSNVAISVQNRLLKIAKERGEDFNFFLNRFAIERFLFRLGQSEYRERFLLKGATLFLVWTGRYYRPTRDLDLLGFGEPSSEIIRDIFVNICRQVVGDDGIEFQYETITAELIREEQEYSGIRVNMIAKLGNARVPMQVDVGFGDAITPADSLVEYPVLLPFPPPRLRAYPRETVIAEKVQAMVALGMGNSRMKDFYDVFVLARDFTFDPSELAKAIRQTFERRKTPFPSGIPLALTTEFAGDAIKQTQWKAFLRRGNIRDISTNFEEVVTAIAAFISPLLAIENMEGRNSSK